MPVITRDGRGRAVGERVRAVITQTAAVHHRLHLPGPVAVQVGAGARLRTTNARDGHLVRSGMGPIPSRKWYHFTLPGGMLAFAYSTSCSDVSPYTLTL